MKKHFLLLIAIIGIFANTKAQEKKFQFSISSEFFAPNASQYNSIAYIQQNNGKNIGGDVTGY